MMIYMNARMALYYNQEDAKKEIESAELPDGILDLLNSALVVRGSGVVFETLIQPASLMPEHFHDITQFESDINHIHIRDYTNDTIRNVDRLWIGLAYAFRLANKLKEEFPNESFQIIVGTDWEGYGDCIVRFVKRRNGKGLYDPDDLEEMQHEAVMIIEA